MNKRLQSRKFMMTILLQISATWMLFTGGCTFDEWSTFSMFIAGTYTGANVLGHAIKPKGEFHDAELDKELAEYNK